MPMASCQRACAQQGTLSSSCTQPHQPTGPNQCCHARAGDANAQHYFVATQEKALRGALGKVPGGASVFLNANGVHLEPPSNRQRRGIEQARSSCFTTSSCAVREGKSVSLLSSSPSSVRCAVPGTAGCSSVGFYAVRQRLRRASDWSLISSPLVASQQLSGLLCCDMQVCFRGRDWAREHLRWHL